MRVEGCSLADTKGARACPYCGERHLQKIHTVNSQGRPLVVECPSCRRKWDWPTVREDEERRREQMRVKSREHYERNRDEILAREHENREHKTRMARERRHRARAHLHPLRTCPTCGSTFRAMNGNHKYCCGACREGSARNKRVQYEIKQRAKRRNEAYLRALEDVAESVGRLGECRAVRDSTK